MKNLLIALTIVFFSSCVSHTGFITSLPSGNQKNTIYKDVAVGYSQYKYIFNIGGFGNNVPMNDAKKSMLLSSPLKPNQAYQNLTYDIKRTYILPFQKVEIFAIADIVEYPDSSTKAIYSKEYCDKMQQNRLLSSKKFNIGDQIIFVTNGNIASGKIVYLLKNKAVIYYTNCNGKSSFKKLKYTSIFQAEGSITSQAGNQIHINDEVVYTKQGATKSSIARVIGIGNTNLLMKSGDKYFDIEQIELNQ